MAKAPTIVAGAASSNDSYSISEDQAAGGAVKFNVRLNDNAKSTLYSLDDLQSSDLLTQDGVLVPQLSRLGATIAITADGQVSYTNSSTQVQALAQGQSLQDSFLYAVRTQNGSLVWQTVTVTITGTNDSPVARADTAAVAEDALTTGSVAGNDSDVDNGAVLTFATTDQIPAGFTMASNGTWALDGSHAAYQSLAAGQSQQYVVQYWVRDQFGASSSSTLTLTVTGRNDAPAAAAASAAVTEDQSISGQLTATDADQANGLTFALSEASPTGFTLNTNGSWTFDASSYDSLAEGETQTIQVRYAAVDSAGARGNAILTITVTGTNDGPVASPAAASVSESGSVSGAVSVTDADAGASYVVEPYYGAPDGFAMASDGNWTFDAAAAGYDWLGEGESQDVLIDYIVTDDRGDTSIATLTITVTGENDDPIANPATATVAEDDVISGQVVVSDPDASASLTVEPPMSYSVPGLEMLSDGSWTFDANQYEYQDLALGESRDILINYSLGDVEGGYDYSTLTVTVQGRNDAPVTTSQWVAGAEGQVSSGAILARDIDNGAQLTFAITGEAPAGLSLSADGSWTFDGTNPAWDHVTGGDTAFVFVPFTVTDEHGAFIAHTIVLAVEGSNDAPAVRVGAALPAGAEDTTYVVSPDQLLALWRDPDQGSQLYISEIAFSNGSVVVGSDSSYRYTPAANFNGTAFITMTVSDGLTSTTTQVPLTIAAINDPATITGTRNGSVIEDQLKNPNALTGVVGDLNSVDPDGSADNDRWTVVTTPTVSSNGYGNFTISAAGVWNYRLDNGNATVEALNTGQTLSDSFTVYTIDGTAQVVTIVINGRTDFSFVAPELPGADPTDFDDLHAEFTQASQVWATSGSPADDVYDGSNLGDLISGSEGADTIYGHDGNDDIYGAAYFPNPGVYELGADTLYGQAGADWIEGGNGPDLIYGGSGNDRIEGDGYNGSLSNDRLYGGSGNDSIYGYGGDDLIVGGYGADSLSGGAGNDTFVYRSPLDVGDTISDYNQSGSGSDRLDLSAIDANVNVDGDQAFVWAGTAPAAYSLWSVVDGRMFGDVDGDPTTAELMIKIGYFIAPPPGIIY